jgi:hypothetical protein
MYRSADGIFAFRLRPDGSGFTLEGTSPRYTAMTLIGLAGEQAEAASACLGGETPQSLSRRMLGQVGEWGNLGDVAVTLWAARALGEDGEPALRRLLAMQPVERPYPTVQVAWSLAALCFEPGMTHDDTRQALARRLVESLPTDGSVFPHELGSANSRSHVACFADLVYPVHALAHYHVRSDDRSALAVATRVADHFCGLQGEEGQWWWHYDVRTGRVIEGYPVYAVHQDAMAPMALFAVQEAGGPDYSEPIARGLRWLAASPELDGGTLVDEGVGITWRKVARREPGKASRYVRAAASRIHPSLRLTALDLLFRPGAIDMEDRPYHLGWLLYAWPERRLAAWSPREAM